MHVQNSNSLVVEPKEILSGVPGYKIIALQGRWSSGAREPRLTAPALSMLLSDTSMDLWYMTVSLNKVFSDRKKNSKETFVIGQKGKGAMIRSIREKGGK